MMKLVSRLRSDQWSDYCVIVLVVRGREIKIDGPFLETLTHWPKALRKSCLPFLDYHSPDVLKAGNFLSFDNALGQRLLFVNDSETQDMFSTLTAARKVVASWKGVKNGKVIVDLHSIDLGMATRWSHALLSADVADCFKFPKYSTQRKKTSKKKSKSYTFFGPESIVRGVSVGGKLGVEWTEATNFVRTLVLRSGNDLTPETYVREIKEMSQKEGLGFTFYSHQQLKKMGAGAFLAVVKGSEHTHGGIVRLSYRPPGKNRGDLVFVGKGITYDTGGINVKPGKYMLGMKGDMGGSAVVLAGIRLASKQRWSVGIDAYLAIAENSVSANAYKPDDVVEAHNGKTIEVIHSDAEGRMVLADTLSLASEEKPRLILDFATLTGSCVSAIGSAYAGVYTNQKSFWPQLIAAGESCGERVWPFPLSEDFGECLESDVADIKQCRPEGGVDHIEAAWFLSQFVKKGVDWVHVDLAASENPGGVAHVPGEYTGFGVRVLATVAAYLLPDVSIPTIPVNSQKSGS